MIDVEATIVEDKLARCSRESNLVYDRLQLRGTDDWGRSEWNPRKLVARVFPRRDDVREGHVRRWLEEYERASSPLDGSGHGLIRIYVVDGTKLFEFTRRAPRRKRLMFCPPPPWAPEADHAYWKAKAAARGFRGATTVDQEDPLALPFDDPLPTPLHGGDDGSTTSRENGRPSVRSGSSGGTNDPPLPPPRGGGLAVDLAGLPEPLKRIVREVNDGRRTPESATRELVERAAGFVVSIRGLATPDVRRSLRRAFRAGMPLSSILEAQAERVRRDLQRRGAFNFNQGGMDAAGEWARQVAAAAAEIGVSIAAPADVDL